VLASLGPAIQMSRFCQIENSKLVPLSDGDESKKKNSEATAFFMMMDKSAKADYNEQLCDAYVAQLVQCQPDSTGDTSYDTVAVDFKFPPGITYHNEVFNGTPENKYEQAYQRTPASFTGYHAYQRTPTSLTGYHAYQRTPASLTPHGIPRVPTHTSLPHASWDITRTNAQTSIPQAKRSRSPDQVSEPLSDDEYYETRKRSDRRSKYDRTFLRHTGDLADRYE
jgi:hypothetical protein